MLAASTYELESHLSLVAAEMPPERRSLAPFPRPEQRCPEKLVTSSLQPSGESQKNLVAAERSEAALGKSVFIRGSKNQDPPFIRGEKHNRGEIASD
ncbi:MAG: hypothetical protein ACK6D4_11105, partial [Planctomyces sp.]